MNDLNPEERELLIPNKPHGCLHRLITLLTGQGIISRDEALDVCYHIPPSEMYMPKSVKYLESKGVVIPSGMCFAPEEDEGDPIIPPEDDPSLVGPGIGFPGATPPPFVED